MSDNNFGRAEQPAVKTASSPTQPAMTDAREDGMSVSQMAQSRLPSFARASRVSHAAAGTGRGLRRSAPWSALSFGLLLLASLSACLERLAWMGGH